MFAISLYRPGVFELFSRMLSQGANQSCTNKKILKGFRRYPDVLIWQELKEIIYVKKNDGQIRTSCL